MAYIRLILDGMQNHSTTISKCVKHYCFFYIFVVVWYLSKDVKYFLSFFLRDARGVWYLKFKHAKEHPPSPYK